MVDVTVAMSADAALSANLTPQVGDLFDDRLTIGSLPHSEAVDISGAGIGVGETTDGMIKTVWRELGPVDLNKLRVVATGTSPRVGVWRQTQASLDAGSAPALSNLERVGGTGQSTLSVNIDSSWPAHYIQVGVTAGTGADISLLVEDATPPAGGTFADAQQAYGDFGSITVDTTNAVQEAGEPDPTGMAPTASSWLDWEAESTDLIKFSIEASDGAEQVGLAVYTGASLGTLVKIIDAVAPAANGVSVEFTPVAGQLYHVQVSTTDDHNQYSVTWYVPAEAGQVQVPATPHDYLRVELYERDGVTKVTEIKNRVASDGSEPLNIVGAGSLSVPLNDELLKAYPRLLRTGRIVKFFLGDTCISGFRIQRSKSIWISSGEYAGMTKTATGPTLQVLLGDFHVRHDEAPRPDSPATRYYSWASRPVGGTDDWYDPADWDNQINVNSQDDPPGNWKKPAEKRDKFGMPKDWPDKESKWMWMSNTASKNQGGYLPPQPTEGKRYYRKNFSISKNNTKVRMFVTGDETVVVYIDGDEVIRRTSRENGYKTFTKATITLAAGVHTVAIFQQGEPSGKSGDGVDALMFTMYKLSADGTKGDVIVRSNGSWGAWYGKNVPGWNRAQVLKSAIKEARERGVETADRLVMDFDGLVDSEGKEWSDRFNQEVQIGTSGLDLQAQLSESGRFDVWVDPADLKVKAYKRRGKNKSASVALIPGVNLIDYEAEEIDEVGNDFLIQYDKGFTTVSVEASKKANDTREVYVELGGVKDAGTARAAVRGAIAAFRDYRKRAGSPDVATHRTKERGGAMIASPGAYPFLDYNTGDIISAPDEDGRLVPQRVLSLAFKEDAEGKLTYDPELEQVAPPQDIGTPGV